MSFDPPVFDSNRVQLAWEHALQEVGGWDDVLNDGEKALVLVGVEAIASGDYDASNAGILAALETGQCRPEMSAVILAYLMAFSLAYHGPD